MLAGTVYCVWPVLPGKFGSLSICGYSAQGQCQTTGSRWKQCTKAKPLREVKEFWKAETCSCCDSRGSVENGKVWGCRLCWRAFNGIGTWPTLQVNRDHVLKEAEMWRRGVVNLTNLLPGISVDSPGKLLPISLLGVNTPLKPMRLHRMAQWTSQDIQVEQLYHFQDTAEWALRPRLTRPARELGLYVLIKVL